ncbi:MAG: hypothetical protein HQK79_16420 [Desulfobacterales bacterium]|nr:hypothetical protein [Desulfobacterales bacterium]MBF0397141.1 hypothetical protein [Desulfobacterales bacterium]
MKNENPIYYQDVEKCVDDIIKKVGKKIVFGMPLGLGKPNYLANAIYMRAKKDTTIDLYLCTALSLEKPSWSSDLERRFLEPFIKRVFGGYADLEYMKDLRKGGLPSNIQLKEFYCKAGSYLNLQPAQENYISSNYTHAYRDILENNVNVCGQIVCKATINKKIYFSLSCNPEVTLDVAKEMRKQEKEGKKIALIGEINQNLPFMYGDAVVDPALFTAVIDNPEYNYRLFSAPKMSITTTDYMIGFYSSTLIKDGGTLQIGIGSLGDALCYGLQIRNQNNDVYKKLISDANILNKFGTTIERVGGVEPFDEGITGSTEMLVDGYLHLIKSGVVKRKTYNDVNIQRLINEKKITENITPQILGTLIEEGAIRKKLTEENFNFLRKFGIFKTNLKYEKGFIKNGEINISCDLTDAKNMDMIVKNCLGDTLKNGILIHGGFFLGPESFYKALKDMTEEERKQINMTSVLNVNQLYGNEYASQELKTLQRKHGRFVNACLMVTLNGGVVSDALENGQVVSGVGGQYNFVSQAHALPDGRSILMCKGVRSKGKDIKSNVVWNYGHITIPRHLRDIVITEYGIANLRSKSDKEIIMELLNIADSRFQDELLQQAKSAKKLPSNYQIPDQFKNNYPQELDKILAPFKAKGFFQPFPFGTDFTKEELVIGKALRGLKEKMSEGLGKVSSIGKAITIRTVPEKAKPYLERLQLDKPSTGQEKMMQKMVIYALTSSGAI